MTTYTTDEAADRLGIHQKTIQHYVRTGQISAVMIDGRWSISGTALARFLRARLHSKEQCRNGHDLTRPNAYRICGTKRIRRCRTCAAEANRRKRLKDMGEPVGIFLAERCPSVFRELEAATRDLPVLKRLEVALRFWEAA